MSRSFIEANFYSELYFYCSLYMRTVIMILTLKLYSKYVIMKYLQDHLCCVPEESTSQDPFKRAWKVQKLLLKL